MTEKDVVDYWIKSAKEDFLTAETLFLAKRNLACLFFCHLALEKILKALYVSQKHTAPPLIHDLVKLAESFALNTNDFTDDLREISRFNIAARYDDYKFSMYKTATNEFTKKYYAKTKEIYQWLKEKF